MPSPLFNFCIVCVCKYITFNNNPIFFSFFLFGATTTTELAAIPPPSPKSRAGFGGRGGMAAKSRHQELSVSALKTALARQNFFFPALITAVTITVFWHFYIRLTKTPNLFFCELTYPADLKPCPSVGVESSIDTVYGFLKLSHINFILFVKSPRTTRRGITETINHNSIHNIQTQYPATGNPAPRC